MANRDFFSFCTSLKPIELRALGALSQVKHLEAQKEVYRAGDEANALYILNRGMVEIVQEDGPRAAGRTYLSRGDIFGDVEVLTNLPRRHSVQTREPVSLQCFARKDLDELMRRVPAFFHYVSEQLATRLLQARHAALSRSNCLELSGSLTNFDLVTIYQTIVHSSQTGELSIRDQNDELLAAFQFDGGRISGGQFQHLTGEDAFEQLFLARNLRGTFSFCSASSKSSRAISGEMAARDPGEVLIHALQGRDEFDAMRSEFPDGSRRLLRQRLEVAPSELEKDTRPVAQKIWSLASGGRLQMHEIYERLDVSELKIYSALRELIRTGHLELAGAPLEQKVA